MLGRDFRPWGELNWLLSKSFIRDWNAVGCISFEDRMHGLRTNIAAEYRINNNIYYDIQPPSNSLITAHSSRLMDNRNRLIASGVLLGDLITLSLLCSVDDFLSPLKTYIRRCNGNIILDISCFPKRFFFPILKALIKSSDVTNLLVVYTKPSSYTKGELSGNPEEWSHIPGGFMSSKFPEPEADLAIIGVGFMPLGLPKLLTGNYQDARVKLFFPHPPGPPNYQRNWEFVRRIKDSYPALQLNDMNRVHALDTSDAFAQLVVMTNNGLRNSILAPYGPKPISLAMALFAIDQGVPVYYTQPNYYSPEYSTGSRETYAYWIVNNGINHYQL